MGLDDFCNTGLVLGLGFSSTAEIGAPPRKIIDGQKPKSNPAGGLKLDHHLHHQLAKGAINFEPSLTLSLSGETYNDKVVANNKVFDGTKVGGNNSDQLSHDLCRQDSAASSFSNVSVKREREEFVGEEVETTERVSSRGSDEDEDGPNGRKKLRLNKAQSALLEESFKLHSTLNPKQKQALARDLNLRPRQVEVWFQNRRARTKLKQTEVDCEYLKKCCEKLTEENRRLQQELKALKKMAQPLYMELPAATLTMCPSCEMIGGVSADQNAFSNIAPKKPPHHHLFINPSAAC